ncbi:retrovirus-related pol polyprotein from transposon TNT 1-94 [Tanacetum coccineum]
MTHPHPKGNFVPSAVLLKSGLKILNTTRQSSSRAAASVNTTRPINIAYTKPTMNSARPISNVFNRAHSHVRRPFNKYTTNKNNNLKEKVKTVRENVTTVGTKAVVCDNKGNEANVVKASTCNPQLELHEKGVIDSGCSRHITENKSYLSDYEEIDEGFVAFVGNLKGDFKLTYANHVLLKVPRKDNMYIVDLRNVVPPGGLTCLFAKVTSDESNLWHRRLDHGNFKTMNKLGIEREFSVARTPQQNRVAERKNRTLIEAARTMLGKFDGKADEGFFIRYSTNSKEFKVFNSRTRIVEENLHVQFSEHAPNIVESRPNWLFDIDALTKSMNYKPVVAGNQSNGSIDSPFSSSLKDSPDGGFKPSGDEEKQYTKDPGNEANEVPSTKDASVNSTNNINTVSSTVNAVGLEHDVVDVNIVYGCDHDPNMPDMEEIIYSDDDEDVGAEAGMTNLDSYIPKVVQALTDPSWIEAMQDELLKFKLQKVWILVDLPYGKRAIETKWIYRNKKGEKGIVVRNKARLVAQGYTQEEGIDYDEFFAPVARIEAIRLFLAYASFKEFVVYQMDVKSAFLYGKIEDEVYVCQPPGFEDPEFPNRVYKVKKALYGLHQAPRAWTATVKIASTPTETLKPLIKDDNAANVDVHLCRSMIGSLMYLTSSRPDIMFAVCACVRFQVNPKNSHLHAVKRIFRYLKGQPKLGLWYQKDSPFDLVAYTDSDYARASLYRKSTTEGCQFLGCRLISWQCKKQTVVANSTTKAEYVVASSYCGQVLWIQN